MGDKDSFKPSKIDIICIFATPSDWRLSLQILIDILRSRDGIPGSPDWTEQQFTQLLVCNPDEVYPHQWSVPRNTTGSFTFCLKSLFTKLTGLTLSATSYGKPCSSTYDYARKLLKEQYQKLGL